MPTSARKRRLTTASHAPPPVANKRLKSQQPALAAAPSEPLRSLLRHLPAVMANVVHEYMQLTDAQAGQITRTEAKRRFALTDTDLARLPCVQRPNPHGRSAGPMTLFRVLDVETAAIAKHGSLGQTTHVLDKRAATQRKRQQTMQRKAQERKQQLTAALASRGLTLRADSRLCAAYLDGKSGRTLDQVCDVMEEMAFLFAHTDYEQFLDDEIAAARDHKGVYDIDECSDDAKGCAVRDYVDKQAAKLGGAAAASRAQVVATLPRSLRCRVGGR